MANWVGKLNKTIAEIMPCAVDFTDILPPNEVITSGTVTAKDETGVDATSIIIKQTSNSTTQVQAIVWQGTSSMKYVLKFIGNTANYSYESNMTLQVN